MKHASEIVTETIAFHKDAIQRAADKISEAVAAGKFSVNISCASRDELLAIVLAVKTMGYETMSTSSTQQSITISWVEA